ncbi:hypothetical protein WN944_001790 [Citrus x changshan-huyou]|uniref:Bulb-type lectin domain-containing protein n=1 Tax=Citrus x changshan-huyou TaxID=2935761 RepID=A0AAP0QMZ8_9ROSI
MKEQTKVERAKQKTDQEFWYKKQKASQSASGNHEQQEQTQSKMGQERPTVIDGSRATQRQDDRCTGPIKISHVEGLVKGSLMKQGRADKQQTIGCSSVAEIADGELMSRDMSILAGNNEKKERENKFSEDEAVGACTNVKDKKKKWKSQARERVTKGNGNGGPTSLKQPREEQLRVSTEWWREKEVLSLDKEILQRMQRRRLETSPADSHENNKLERSGFELGFFSPGNSKNIKYIGIWYKKSPDTVVWVANRNTPIHDPHGILAISNNGNLVLLNQTNGTIWSSNMSRQIKNPVAKLLDTGNVVLRDKFSSNTCEGNYLWQSFDYPSDTLLSGMKGDAPSFTNFLYVQALTDNEDEISFRYKSYKGPSIMMLKLNPSGKIQRLIWNERSSAWDVQFSAPGICDTYGICGAN